MQNVSSSDVALAGVTAGVTAASLTFSLIVAVITLIAVWKIFTKAKQPGWASLIPIYDVYIMLKIADMEWWYLLLLLLPIANIYVAFKMNIELAHKFGKSTLFGVLMVFFSTICYLILGFGDAKYKGARK